MGHVLKVYENPKLALKIRRLRSCSLIIAALVPACVAVLASDGKLAARGSATGGRFISDGVSRTVTWSAEPFVFSVTLLWYLFVGFMLVVAFYAVVARIIEKNHGRPFFRRKYPY